MPTRKLSKAIERLAARLKMAKSAVNRILKMDPRPDNVESFKYVVLFWLIEKSCKISIDSTDFRTVPECFRNESFFRVKFKHEDLKLRFIDSGEDISAVLIHKASRVNRVISEDMINLPDVASVTTGSDTEQEQKDEITRSYNEIIYSLETEFYRPILHYLHKNEKPRSTPSTPKRSHSRRH